MGLDDAIRDNVPMGKDINGYQVYYPRCHICGQKITSWSYLSEKVYTCCDCKMNYKSYRKEITTDKKRAKLEKAIHRVSAVSNIGKYYAAIDWVKDNIKRLGWFDSTEEIMVALELYKRNIDFRHQIKIFNFQADFVLLDEKIVLEIDGKIYHGGDKRAYDRQRDELIILKLGPDWDVINSNGASVLA